MSDYDQTNVAQGPWKGPSPPPPPSPPIDGASGGPHIPGMDARLARVEGTVETLKIVLLVIAAVMIGGFAFLGVQLTRADGKLDRVSGEVSALPDKINANLRDLTRTLSEAITAAKQAPPQVILVPTPAAPAPATK